ncbi:hypothetical protein SMD44_00672 [Streptomyces alboflavus]|uniref:Uncharacterized protein n=1 Tax=Streptomyces alboflavus TaxID=67267 RepID=A0A1Z1W4D4_9ACTN|nr:hypothetical protein SMD44_00672 [Streptomyces alboflavus]
MEGCTWSATFAVPLRTPGEWAGMWAPPLTVSSHHGKESSMPMSRVLWSATMPLPLRTYFCTASRWASVSQTMPEFCSMTMTSKSLSLASSKTVESSVWTTSKSWAAACSLTIWMPAGMESWT